MDRRHFVLGALTTGVVASCGQNDEDAGQEPGPPESRSTTRDSAGARSIWSMPAEETEHERTWMCWPSNRSVWGDDLEDVQDTIANLA